MPGTFSRRSSARPVRPAFCASKDNPQPAAAPEQDTVFRRRHLPGLKYFSRARKLTRGTDVMSRVPRPRPGPHIRRHRVAFIARLLLCWRVARMAIQRPDNDALQLTDKTNEKTTVAGRIMT
jgi:hypothetical protein